MILNSSKNENIIRVNNNMTLFHKVWGEVRVVDYDDKYITISLNNNETKKLLLSSIGTYLFYDKDEIKKFENNENKQTVKKADEFRKHYKELGIDETSDYYSSSIVEYEDVEWPSIGKPKGIEDDESDNEPNIDENNIFDHYSEEIIS